jgi:polyhydroxyalkanoate synthesis regulator phasin
MKSLETLQEQSDDMVKKSQLNEESLKRLALSLDKTRKLVARISGADNSFDQLESKITEIEEANKSNMAFREQISEALIRIQADLSSLEIALEDK